MELRERIARLIDPDVFDVAGPVHPAHWASPHQRAALSTADKIIAALGIPPDRLEAVANGSAEIVDVAVLRRIAFAERAAAQEGKP